MFKLRLTHSLLKGKWVNRKFSTPDSRSATKIPTPTFMRIHTKEVLPILSQNKKKGKKIGGPPVPLHFTQEQCAH